MKLVYYLENDIDLLKYKLLVEIYDECDNIQQYVRADFDSEKERDNFINLVKELEGKDVMTLQELSDTLSSLSTFITGDEL